MTWLQMCDLIAQFVDHNKASIAGGTGSNRVEALKLLKLLIGGLKMRNVLILHFTTSNKSDSQGK